jgi:hypothetical protein
MLAMQKNEVGREGRGCDQVVEEALPPTVPFRLRLVVPDRFEVLALRERSREVVLENESCVLASMRRRKGSVLREGRICQF